ncbi:histidine kinase [Sphingobacteriaceae bacterium]|nr:histidine kinase [Sphingobacteriaceae bacterium]
MSINPLYSICSIFLIAAGIIIWYAQRLKKERKQKKVIEDKYNELELKVNSLELDSIKYKLNPHLFKNTLNSIQSHAYQTYYALDKLSNVLDFILYESDRTFVSLKEEIGFALSLIEINRLKVSPLFDLRIKNKIGETNPLYEQELIAPLITIDLIENAFKHADLQSDGAFISIVFELKDEVFSLTVSNKMSSRPAMKKTKGGFGKKSFEKRLSIIYKDNYTLDQFTEDDIYISHLKINLLEHKAQMLAIG